MVMNDQSFRGERKLERERVYIRDWWVAAINYKLFVEEENEGLGIYNKGNAVLCNSFHIRKIYSNIISLWGRTCMEGDTNIFLPLSRRRNQSINVKQRL